LPEKDHLVPERPELAPLLLAMPDSAIHDRLSRFTE